MSKAKGRGQTRAFAEDEMLQNETDLKPIQIAVLEKLVAGLSVSEAARTTNVARSTVHRWLKDNFNFQAELNRLRRELHESVQAILLAAAVRAAETVAQAVEAGDVSASLKLLTGIGTLSGNAPPIAPDDPDILREENELARQAEISDRKLRWFSATLM